MEQQWQDHNRSSPPWDDPVSGWQDSSRTDADVVYSCYGQQFKHCWVAARKLVAFSSGNLITALLRTCWNRQSKLKSCTNSASSYFHRKKSAEVHSNEHSRRASHNFTHAIQTMHIATSTQGQGVFTQLFKATHYWLSCIFYFPPIFILVIFVFSFYNHIFITAVKITFRITRNHSTAHILTKGPYSR